jgi:hypothetical protein
VEDGTGEYECPYCGCDITLVLRCPLCCVELEVEDWDECSCPDCDEEFDPWEAAEVE